MRRLTRWILRGVAVLLVLIVLLVGAATTPWFKNLLRRELVHYAANAVEGDLQVGALTGSLWSDVSLHDVVIRQHGQPVVEVALVSAHYHPLQLLAGRIVVDAVLLDRPVVHLIQEENGWNLSHLIRTKTTPSDQAPRAFEVGRIDVSDGEAFVQPRQSPERHLIHMGLEGRVSYSASGLSAKIASLSAEDADTKVALRASADVATSEREVTLRHLLMQTGQSALAGDLQYKIDGGRAAFNGTLDVRTLAVREFAPYLPASAPLDLTAAGTVRASGSADAMHAEWRFDTNAGRIAGQGTMPLPGGRARLPITASVELAGVDPRKLTGVASLAGRLTGSATLDGEIDTADVTDSHVAFTVRADRSSLMGYEASAVAARGTFDRRTLQIDGRAAAYGASATVSGTIRNLQPGGTPTGTLAGRLQHLDLTRLPARLHAPAIATDVSGAYTVGLRANGTSATLDAEQSTVAGAVIAADTTASVDVRGTALAGRITGRVDHVPGDLLHVSAARGATDVGGTIDADVRVADLRRPMNAENLSGTALVTLDGSTVAGESLTRARAAATLANGLLEVRELDLRAKSATVTATGVVAVAPGAEGESDLTYTVDTDDLSALPGVSVAGLSGLAHIEGRIQGPYDRLVATGTYRAQELKYGTTLDALTVDGDITATLPGLDVKQLEATVSADGAMITIKGQEIRHLTLRSTYRQEGLDLTARVEQPERTLDVDGSLVLQPEAQEVRIRQFGLAGTGAGAGAPWRLADSEGAVIRYGAQALSIDHLTLARGAERIAASGQLAREAPSDSTLTLQLTGVQVGDLYGLLMGPPRFTGTASGSVRLQGSLAKPAVDASLEVTDGRVANVPYTRASAEVHLREKRVAVDGRIDEPTGASFTVQGEAPLAATAGPLDLHVTGTNVSLGLLQAATDHLQNVQGQAAMDVRVGGPMAEPTFTGTVQVANGAALIAPTGVTYTGITADVQLEGRRATVRDFHLTDDDGHPLTATGGGDLLAAAGGTRAIDVHLQTDEIHVLHNDLGNVEVTAQLEASGTVGAPTVEGRIEVVRGRLEADKWLQMLTEGSTAPASAAPDATTPAPAPAAVANNAMASAPPTEAEQAAAAAAVPAAPASQADQGLFANSTIDVNLVMPDNFVLRGRDLRTSGGSMGLGNLNLTIGGDLRLRKAPARKIEVVGSLQGVRGFYDFQGRRFQIVRGSAVTFRGVDPANPSLNVTGEREISGIVAQVQVTGTVRRPTLKLSSRPPLEEGDVLSLIVFNQPMNELGEGEQVDLMQRASSMALSAVATPLADSIGRALDVDLFEIRTPTAGQAGEVNVGRQVNERLFVGFRQEFGETDASRLTFEYRLTDALRLLTSVAQGADRTKRTRDREAAGMDLLYVLQY
jgi:autotransporter translocation and assembly factor TamB